MHREELVEDVGRHQVAVRPRELQAHDQRLEATDAEEDERRDEVEDADALVVDRGDPRVRAVLLDVVRVRVRRGGGLVQRGVGDRHRSVSK